MKCVERTGTDLKEGFSRGVWVSGFSYSDDKAYLERALKRVIERLNGGLFVLRPRERDFVFDRIGLNPECRALTYCQIGKKYGVTTERARVIIYYGLSRILRAENGEKS